MPRSDHVVIEGRVTSALGGGQYEVRPQDGADPIRAQLCGKMKRFGIRLIVGDDVQVEVAPSDKTHGIVTWRTKR